MAVKYVTPELKQYYLDLIERIRDAFRNRSHKLDWMSETTRKQRPCSLQALDRNKRFFQLILADNARKSRASLFVELDNCKFILLARI